MARYIDKDALVAEINQRIEDYKSHKIDDSYHDGLIFAVEDLRDDFIDTLEVKEVDIEKEMDSYFNTMQVLEHENIFETTFQKIAKHFFELGLSVSNKAEKEVEEEPYVMSDKGKFTTTTK